MKSIFSGMLIYEVVLLFAGILVLALLLREVFKKGFNPTNGFGFLIPLAFIGWPSIQSVSFGNGQGEIKKDTAALQENPNDKAVKENLEKNIEAATVRASSAEDLVTISNGQLALGNPKKAAAIAEKVLEKEPENPKALEVKKVVAVEEHIKQVKENPNDEAAKQALKVQLDALEKVPTQTSNKTVSLAEGYFLLNNATKAMAYVDSTKAIQPANLRIKKISNNFSRITPK